jgi:pimeloyl-ACP methyl ester carboxylesterase
MAITTTKPTVVIVHGAWTDGSSFAEVQGILTAAGHDVLDFANPLRSLAGDVAYLAAFLQARTAGPVILVGHSYGGALIGAAGLKASNVVGLVYVGAFIPIEGESLLGLLSSTGSVDPSQLFDMVPYPGAPDGDVDLYIKRASFGPAFATGLAPDVQATYYARQRPITFTAVSTPSADGQAWQTLPSWYVAGALDGSIPFELQVGMADRAGANVTKIDAGHLSMVSNAREIAGVIEKAAASIQD